MVGYVSLISVHLLLKGVTLIIHIGHSNRCKFKDENTIK